MKKPIAFAFVPLVGIVFLATRGHHATAGIEDPPVCGTFAAGMVDPVPPIAALGTGIHYSTGFESGEGFPLGYISNTPGTHPAGCGGAAFPCWGHTTAANASLITPSIESVNPADGLQHLRLIYDPSTRTNTTGLGLGVDARFPRTADLQVRPVAPTTVSVDLAISGPGGQDFRLQPQSNSQGCIQGSALFYQDGGIYVLDDFCGTTGVNFQPTGFSWDTTGAYQNFTWVMNPCTDTMEYYYGGQMIYSGCVVFGTNLEQFLVFGDNYPGSHMDVDNVVMESEDSCPCICGNGVVEPWCEQCDDFGADANCPGRCIPPGQAGECTCSRICTMDEPCELNSGLNGPFYGPFDATNQGFFQYQAPSGVDAVSVELCGSTGIDQRIYSWGSCTDPNDPGATNDDCCDLNDPNCGSFGIGSDPNASCYDDVGPPNYESCTCHDNPLPGDNCYLLQIRTPATNGQVFIGVTDRSECGAAPVCGNDVVEPPFEECEPGVPAACGSGSTCGHVGTSEECQCIPEPVCGDGILEEPYEECEPGGASTCSPGLECAGIGTTYECQCIFNNLNPPGKIVAWGENVFGQLNVPHPNTDFVAVAGGQYFSMGLKANGSIVAWGDNTFGQTNVPEPNSGFVAISAGGAHCLGLKADGSVVAWGNNLHGQSNVPAPNSNFVAVAAGKLHSVGLKSDGTIVHWGLSNGFMGNVPSPSLDYTAISAADDHSLALRQSIILAWGYLAPEDLPIANSGFTAISASQHHNLALREVSGAIASGGTNNHGQLNVPAPNAGFVGIATGDFHSLGLRETGAVAAWGCGGSSNRGQCDVPLPNENFLAIEAGSNHSLAIQLEPVGACCDTNGTDQGCTENVAQANCAGSDNVWTENGQCNEIVCECILDCTGAVCGDDGCGGSCGSCGDGNVCNGEEACGPSRTCQPGTPLNCNDGNACNGFETCNPSSGCVPGTPLNCNNGQFCDGLETCNPAMGCAPGIAPCAEDETCDEESDLCIPNNIPTMSQWGLVVLTLLMLATAKVKFKSYARAK